MNLCTNAAQAMMPAGGTLRVTLDIVQITADKLLSHGSLRTGSYVRLGVIDTGHGMDGATLERAFDPFFTTKEVGSGTGLGLSLVHGIVSDLAGAIHVESGVNAGARFEIYLPLTRAEVDGKRDDDGQIPRGNGEVILLVDDEEALVRLNEELLAELGYEAVGFTSPSAALDELRADPTRFDLVLTDEAMPRMTGTELALAIRELRPDLPVILMSGFNNPALAQKARAAGVHLVLGKPLQARDIAKAVATILRAETHALGELTAL